MGGPHTGSWWLVGLEGKARRIALHIDGPILIGRGNYNHVVLDDERLSRQHARISPEPDGYVIVDLSSANGTHVNGVAVKRQLLSPNDVVRMGPYTFRIERRESSDSARLDYEPPTVRSVESVSKMAIAADRDSTTHVAAVDLMQLEDAYNNLGTLYAFVQAISKTIDTRELLELISAKIRQVYPRAKSVGIYLRSDTIAAEPFRLAHFSGTDRSGESPTFARVEAALMDGSDVVRRNGTSMIAPMIDRDDHVLGVIHMTAEAGGTFSRADLDLLIGMATPAAIMLQNTYMHEASLARDRLNYDLELAAQIQKSLLPREVVTVEGVELLAEYRAAYSVGGDFYDVFWVAPNRLAVFIGDISGKGVSAALLMARISSELRVAALAHVEPVAVLSMMNKATLGHGRPELFFTAIYLTLDVTTGEVLLANAGHPAPYFSAANGSVEAITDGAAGAIGILEETEFAMTTLTLAHGDSLVLYTDGVVEASDAQGNLYGSERLERCLTATGPSPGQIAEGIIKSVTDHSSHGPLRDDLTLFICHRCVGRPPSLQPRRRSNTTVQAVSRADIERARQGRS
jgi:sigma-B regulation protein RsbU (phosphoserine phosphatase)